MDYECTVYVPPSTDVQQIRTFLREHVILNNPPYNVTTPFTDLPSTAGPSVAHYHFQRQAPSTRDRRKSRSGESPRACKPRYVGFNSIACVPRSRRRGFRRYNARQLAWHRLLQSTRVRYVWKLLWSTNCSFFRVPTVFISVVASVGFKHPRHVRECRLPCQ